VSTDLPLPEVTVTTKAKPTEETKTRRIPPYHVILENDDHHSADFVVDVLCKALGFTLERSYQLMMLAHTTGRSVVWTGTKEVAELKADQIQSFHEIRESDGAKLGPLGCLIEPAPGG
jgi:ATP-dependent Clp protease adaptor protein ClpS